MTQKSRQFEKTINLALQGGGSHGAFTWGVLDKLLEDGRIGIDGICGTSAGAMNACVLAWGMHKGGPEVARETLHDFWWRVSEAGKALRPMSKWPLDKYMPWKMTDSLSHIMGGFMSRVFSPYQLNPYDMNPLRDVLSDVVDFDELKQHDGIKLFISTTHVHSGRVRVFNTKDISLDVVMASACLPSVFKAVSIDGEDYWDGGYVGNPALFPLFYKTNSRDLLIVHINPINRFSTPKTAVDIANRINEISFNASLLSEMRAIAFVKKLLEHDMLKEEHKANFKDILVHSVRTDDVLLDLPLSSKSNSDWGFLTSLRDKGRQEMSLWLEQNFDDVGVKDTVDLHQTFLNSNTKIFEDENGQNRHVNK
ncbi:MAG: alpha/beta hydrolase [Piscirickettsiaceae bacterium]|nr:MAG: alpha/beta hydrolase [Piscirickettsiaceae bacterium]PCI67814.1 MAG: alpha/beta hydrolase [Piscirickettsiaceae bacterium]